VYARISSQFSWIKQTICGAHGSPKPDFCGSNPPPPPGPSPPVTPPPSSSAPTPSPECEDDPVGWYDSDGDFYNCKRYAEGDNCAEYGDLYENFGKTANEACCACGGGSDGGGPSPPPPGPSPCPAGQSLLEIEMSTDNYSSVDNLFRVQRRENGHWTKVWQVKNFQDSSYETFARCFSNNQCHMFVMVDKFENGMCCEDGQGWYKLTWGGTVIKDSDFLDGKFERTRFGNTC